MATLTHAFAIGDCVKIQIPDQTYTGMEGFNNVTGSVINFEVAGTDASGKPYKVKQNVPPNPNRNETLSGIVVDFDQSVWGTNSKTFRPEHLVPASP
ncbi:MAG: hypothetical protein L6Q57_07075 [Alphaproteobacteria bacterium]|nr:hypothetical protein [Alphaproteobacteria bacterium]